MWYRPNWSCGFRSNLAMASLALSLTLKSRPDFCHIPTSVLTTTRVESVYLQGRRSREQSLSAVATHSLVSRSQTLPMDTYRHASRRKVNQNPVTKPGLKQRFVVGFWAPK